MNGGGGGAKGILFAIISLISVTFGLLVFLFIYNLFPDGSLGPVLGALADAVRAILGSVPDIVDEITSSFHQ